MGIKGAAFVSLFSYFIADFAIYACFAKTRPLFFIATKSILGLVVSPKESYKNILYTIGSK